MREIRLQVEKLSEENFDNFVILLTRSRGMNKSRHPDLSIFDRLKEDAFSKNPHYEAYLGKIGPDWVAYVIFSKSYSTFAALPCLSIDEIYVLDDFRELGIGAAMFEFCVRKAKNRRYGKIEFWVPNQNKKAKNFFEFNGAVRVDSIRYQIDLSETKIGKPRGKMTYADVLRKKQAITLSRLNSRANNDSNLFA
jgi:GNAT superfamily N-acetyltransferase